MVNLISIVAPLVCLVRILSLFCNAVLSVLSSFAIISLRKRELAALLQLCTVVTQLLVFCVSSL